MLAFSDRLELHRQPNVVTQGLWRGWLQEQLLAGLALYPSRPLLYRLFDRLHPTVALRDRGVQLYIQQPELLDLQLDVIAHLRSQGADQLHLLLPFVRNLDEFDFCWRRIEGMGLLDDPSLAVWMMAEVPSVLLLLDRYLARGVRGVSIGMNDLAALLLGWDREQDDSRAFTNLAEPALVEAIEQIAQTAKLHQVQCQLCSDLIADYPQTLQRALLAGVTAISVSADRLDQTALAIAEVEQQLGWAHSLPPIAPHTPFACDLAKHRSHLHPTQRPPGSFP